MVWNSDMRQGQMVYRACLAGGMYVWDKRRMGENKVAVMPNKGRVMADELKHLLKHYAVQFKAYVFAKNDDAFAAERAAGKVVPEHCDIRDCISECERVSARVGEWCLSCRHPSLSGSSETPNPTPSEPQRSSTGISHGSGV